MLWLTDLLGCLFIPLDWDDGSSTGPCVLGATDSLGSSVYSCCGSGGGSAVFEGSFAAIGDEGTFSVSEGKLARFGPGEVCHGEVPAGWSASLGNCE